MEGEKMGQGSRNCRFLYLVTAVCKVKCHLLPWKLLPDKLWLQQTGKMRQQLPTHDKHSSAKSKAKTYRFSALTFFNCFPTSCAGLYEEYDHEL